MLLTRPAGSSWNPTMTRCPAPSAFTGTVSVPGSVFSIAGACNSAHRRTIELSTLPSTMPFAASMLASVNGGDLTLPHPTTAMARTQRCTPAFSQNDEFDQPRHRGAECGETIRSRHAYFVGPGGHDHARRAGDGYSRGCSAACDGHGALLRQRHGRRVAGISRQGARRYDDNGP